MVIFDHILPKDLVFIMSHLDLYNCLKNEFKLITDFNEVMFVKASSPDTDSINISSDTDTSSSESELEFTKQSAKETKTRPSTAKSRQFEDKDGEQSNKNVNEQKDASDGKYKIYKKEHETNVTKSKL